MGRQDERDEQDGSHAGAFDCAGVGSLVERPKSAKTGGHCVGTSRNVSCTGKERHAKARQHTRHNGRPMNNTVSLFCLCAGVLCGSSARGLADDGPRNLGVTFNGESDAVEPLATDTWHTITASYRYDGKIGLLTNTYLVLARGGDLLSGFDVGYHLPTNQLGIVKHGYWNATEATGAPGEAGKVIENDQGYLDCENTTVRRTDDEIVGVLPHQVQARRAQGLLQRPPVHRGQGRPA